MRGDEQDAPEPLLAFSIWVYHDFDLNFYTDLPEIFRALFGLPAEADISTIAISELLAGYGAWVIAGMAIAWGSGSIASEEGNGTIGLLLGNPRSRNNVLLSKAAAMVLLIGLAAATLWGSTLLWERALDADISGVKVGALAVHLFASSVFYGFLAMALGAWNGRRGTAAGITAGVMFISVFAVSLFPFIEGWENLAKFFPWYYFSGGEPLTNGVNWGHLGILLGGSAILAVISVIGVNRRDLRGQSLGVTIIDRLRRSKRLSSIANRLAGSARVSRIWIKTYSEHQGLVIITGYVMFLIMGLLIGPLYNWVPKDMFDIFDQFPEALLAAFGASNMSTPEGFYQAETFGLMAPIAVMLVAIAIGARALASEEEKRTMGLLLANPVRRSTIVIEKACTMLIGTFAIGFITFLGVWLGSLLGGLDMDVGNIAATCLLVTLLGLAIGTLALALSAATGKTRVAIFGSIGAALVFYVAASFLPLNDSLAGLAKLSPHYHYISSDPLVNGMNWGHGAVLAGLALGLIALSVFLFQRRDLRQGG